MNTVQDPPVRLLCLDLEGNLASMQTNLSFLLMRKLGSFLGKKHTIYKFELSSVSYIAGCSLSLIKMCPIYLQNDVWFSKAY